MTARGSVAVFTFSVFVGIAAVGAEDTSGFRCGPPSFLTVEEEPRARPSLSLAWLDVAGLSPGVESIARSETASVLEAMGIRTRWRRARPIEAAREKEIRVVLVDRLVVDPDTRRPILGATAARSRTFPIVWVHLASVRTTLGLPVRRSSGALPLRELRDLGLALGRVVAHEAVHVTAPALSHGRGLMSRALSRRALTSPRMPFDPGVAVVVRASLRGTPVALAAQSQTLAASGSFSEPGDDGSGEATGIAAARDAGFRDAEIHADRSLHR